MSQEGSGNNTEGGQMSASEKAKALIEAKEQEKVSAIEATELLIAEKAEKEAADAEAKKLEAQQREERFQKSLADMETSLDNLAEEKKNLEKDLESATENREDVIGESQTATSELSEAGILEGMDEDARAEVFGGDSEKATEIFNSEKEMEARLKEIEKEKEGLESQKEEIYNQTEEGAAKIKEEMNSEIMEKANLKMGQLDYKNEISLKHKPYIPKEVFDLYEEYGEGVVKEAVLDSYTKDIQESFGEKEGDLESVKVHLDAVSPEAIKASKEKYEEFKEAQKLFVEAVKEMNKKVRGLEDSESLIRGEYKAGDISELVRNKGLVKNIEEFYVDPDRFYPSHPNKTYLFKSFLDVKSTMDGLNETIKKKTEDLKTISEKVSNISDADELLAAIGNFSDEDDDFLMRFVVDNFNKKHLTSKESIESEKMSRETLGRMNQMLYYSSNSFSGVRRQVESDIANLKEEKREIMSIANDKLELAFTDAEAEKDFEYSGVHGVERQKEDFERSTQMARIASVEANSLMARLSENLDKNIVIVGGGSPYFEIEGMASEIEKELKERDSRLESASSDLKSKQDELGPLERNDSYFGRNARAERVKKLNEDIKELKKNVLDIRNENHQKRTDAQPDLHSYFKKLTDPSDSSESLSAFIKENREQIEGGVTLKEVLELMKTSAQEKSQEKFPQEKQDYLDKMNKLEDGLEEKIKALQEKK